MTHAVILAGGCGKRFWPKSRRKQPKQLLCFGRKYSPIQNLFNTISVQIPKSRIWVVANREYAAAMRRHLPSLPKRNLLLEPLSKNTAAAIGLASITIRRIDPQAVTLVLSSDQIVGQKKQFLKTLKQASKKAQDADRLLTIGIRPDRPAIEFGYIKIGRSSRSGVESNKIYKVERFVEKPDRAKAKRFLQSKNYLWNGGIFAWKAAGILKAIKKHLPETYAGLQRVEKARRGSAQYKNTLVKEYGRFKNISIDYGVMEKADNIYAIAGDFLWQDLGSWGSLFAGRDSRGNIVQGLHKGIDTSDSVVFSEDRHLIGTVGVRDLIIVHTPLATLVCDKNKAQDVKKLIEALEKDRRLKRYL
jgi:mannose-1-phosphate guanylyltransferase